MQLTDLVNVLLVFSTSYLNTNGSGGNPICCLNFVAGLVRENTSNSSAIHLSLGIQAETNMVACSWWIISKAVKAADVVLAAGAVS